MLICLLLSFMAAGCSGEISSCIPSKDPEENTTITDTSKIEEGEDIVDFLLKNGYEKSWFDEFNGEFLDMDSWNYEIGTGDWGWGNNEEQYYSPNVREVSVGDDVLSISANKVGDGWFSGRIKTQRCMQFRYGYIEARVKLPEGTGMWPAFWLLGCNEDGGIQWPHTGEYDIMEYAPGTNGNKVFSTLHTGSNNGGNGYGLGSASVDDEYLDNYHRFGLLWEPGYIEAYYDGVKVGRKDAPSDNQAQWPFDNVEAFVILNLAIGGNLGGYVPPEATRYEYLIDYVRLYQGEGQTLHLF